MEQLFRFVMTRPAERVEVEETTIAVRPSAGYEAELKQARSSDAPRVALERVALAYARSAGALRSVDELHYRALKALFTELKAQPGIPFGQLKKLIKDLLGATAKELAANPKFAEDRGRLSDVLVTNALLGRDELVASGEAARLLRAAAVVEEVATTNEGAEVAGAVQSILTRQFLLPADVFPVMGTRAPAASTAELAREDGGVDRRAALASRRDGLRAAYTLLTHVRPEQLAVPELPVGRRQPPPAPAAPRAPKAARPKGTASPAAVASPPAVPAMVPRSGAPLLLTPQAVAGFGERERAMLTQRGLDVTRVSLTTALDRLSAELQDVELELAELDAPAHTGMSRVGASFLPTSALAPGSVAAGSFASAGSIPTTYGSVAPAGIGDLLVVKQSLKRYEARELAHVENILKGEYHERMHRRSRTTEETVTTETVVESEEQRDLQSTERFELRNELSQLLKEESSVKLGVALSGSYGPLVEFKNSADVAMEQSKEQATKVATGYCKDVTSRAMSRLFERRREERIVKTIDVFEEKTTHGVDNKAGSGHVIGQYQWVDKIYEAQVFNYGKRLLFDIMLPEPAAFLLSALGSQPSAGSALVKPPPFTLKPSDITEGNYGFYVKQYDVVGVEPPPPPYITASTGIDGAVSKDQGTTTKTAGIPIKEGYQALYGTVVHSLMPVAGNLYGMLDVIVGDNNHTFGFPEGPWAPWTFSMDNEVGTVPVVLLSSGVFAVSIEICCQRTQRAFEEWQLKTHGMIAQAYKKQLRDYEEKLAACEAQATQQIQGRNPGENERLIRGELKKGAISTFTDQHYDLFGAIALSAQGYPQPNLAEASVEGKYIRFFEQAFEWEQMMFLFYPYFWGRKDNWVDRALLQDVDPMFAEFLKAGAARVVVPVRLGFEQAVAHFFDTGKVWDGGELPTVTSPLYVSIIKEIQERDDAPGAEIPQGDPWDVRLPTTLVKIRDDAALPSWHKNAQGQWVPA